jgi:hypothetical protein
MQLVVSRLGILRGLVQKLGPYLILEIVLPGGTLCALLLFLYRRWRRGADTPRAAVPAR